MEASSNAHFSGLRLDGFLSSTTPSQRQPFLIGTEWLFRLSVRLPLPRRASLNDDDKTCARERDMVVILSAIIVG